ncbi:MAG: Fe-S cluster assembly protein SufD [Pseudomonadota bacterium]
MSTMVFLNPTAMEAGLEAAFAALDAPSDAARAAFARVAKRGLPTRREEGWRWSDFSAALRQREPKPVATPEDALDASPFVDAAPFECSIIDGRIVTPEAAAPDGVDISVSAPLAPREASADHPMATLNGAMAQRALQISVADGAHVARPILIRHIAGGEAFSFAQSNIVVGAGAKATIIETYEGEGAGFYSHLNHVSVAEQAALSRVSLQTIGDDAVLHQQSVGDIAAGAQFRQTGLATGARLSRAETMLDIVGEDADVMIDSASLAEGNRHQDFTTHMRFKARGCSVRQRHKSVSRGRGRSIFQGKFEVARPAQKTDAQMAANALLLSDGAEANHKPELEIYADDVECAHGSTCGALDEEALFYLRQRGLKEEAARALLIDAFLSEVFDNIDDETVRGVFRAGVARWLGTL